MLTTAVFFDFQLSDQGSGLFDYCQRAEQSQSIFSVTLSLDQIIYPTQYYYLYHLLF